jgi:hypothetical protein
MAGAPTAADTAAALSIPEGIRISKRLPKESVGGCNGCTDRHLYTHVTEVSLRGALFRLCPACASALKKGL